MNGQTKFDTKTETLPSFREFVALIAAVMALVALAIDSMLPALPAIGNSLGVDQENHRQYVIAFFMIGFGVAQLVVGTLSDRFGRRPVLLVSLGCYTLFSIVAAFAPSFELLLAARVAQGASAAGGRVLVVSIVRDRYAGRQMARVMSLAFIVFMAAPVLAPAVGQAVLLFASWRWIFLFLALFGLAIGIWAGRRLPETLHPEYRLGFSIGRLAAAFAKVVRDRPSVGYTIASALLTGGLFGFISSIQQIFADIFQVPELMAPIFACVAGTMAISSLINSRLVERLGMRFLGHWALIGYTVFAAIHLAVALTGYENLIIFAVLQALLMGCFGLAGANFSALAMEHLGDVAGTASSLQGAFASIVGALIGLFIGQAYDGTTVPLYIGFTVCGLLGLSAALITERGRLFGRQA